MELQQMINALTAITEGKTVSFNFRLHDTIKQMGPAKLKEFLEDIANSEDPVIEVT